MKYMGKIQDPKDLVTKEYVDSHSTSGDYVAYTEQTKTEQEKNVARNNINASSVVFVVWGEDV